MAEASLAQFVRRPVVWAGDNSGVSIEQVAAQAVGVVHRARALFGGSAQPPVPGGPMLEPAAGAVHGAGSRAGELCGGLVEQHDRLVTDAAMRLIANSNSDTSLHQTLSGAAFINQRGADRLDAIAEQTRVLAQGAPAARSPAAQRALLHALRTRVLAAGSVVDAAGQQSRTVAGKIRTLDYQPSGRIQSTGFGADGPPQSPPPPDPPHGKDPRYWIDVTKIIQVPQGGKAPYGSKQIGPGLWYPFDDGMSRSGPPAAKYPLDLSKLVRLSPGQLGPYSMTELVPGVFTPDPRRRMGVEPKWPSPQQPVDIRDIINVPPGQLAPYNYVEYLPGWFTPRDSNPLH